MLWGRLIFGRWTRWISKGFEIMPHGMALRKNEYGNGKFDNSGLHKDREEERQ